MHLFRQAIWGDIWKHTVGKRQTNATSVTLHPLRLAIWGHIWWHTVEKSQTNATNATMHPLTQAIWGHIWRHTVEKSQTNATNVASHPLRQAIWGDIWRHTVEKSLTKIHEGFWTKIKYHYENADKFLYGKVLLYSFECTCKSEFETPVQLKKIQKCKVFNMFKWFGKNHCKPFTQVCDG